MEVDSSQGRQKRATKTPKRFNETFDKPSKQGSNPAKPSPDMWQTSKNVIKIKLTTRPRPYPLNTKPAPIPKFKEESSVGESDESTDRDQSRETPKAKEATKVEKAHAPKDTKEKPSKEPFKLKGPLKIKLKLNPKPDLKPPQPQAKRPDTPPILPDLIPDVVEEPLHEEKPVEAEKPIDDETANGLIRCHCGIDEDLGLMVQCEACLTWQHGHCLGIDQPEDAPDGYTCRACSSVKEKDPSQSV